MIIFIGRRSKDYSGPREFQPIVLCNIVLYASRLLSIGKSKHCDAGSEFDDDFGCFGKLVISP